MPVFKFVVSDPKTRKSHQVEVEQSKARGIMGRKISEELNGDIIGLNGYTLQITGGSDKDGFPMRQDFPGTARKSILLSGGSGFHPREKGQRKRKLVRGNAISEQTSQVNVKIAKEGPEPLDKLLPTQKKEEKAEKKK